MAIWRLGQLNTSLIIPCITDDINSVTVENTGAFHPPSYQRWTFAGALQLALNVQQEPSKLIRGFVKFFALICQNSHKDLSKVFHPPCYQRRSSPEARQVALDVQQRRRRRCRQRSRVCKVYTSTTSSSSTRTQSSSPPRPLSQQQCYVAAAEQSARRSREAQLVCGENTQLPVSP